MSKLKMKLRKRILAYVLTGAMIVSNMASSTTTVFADEATPDTRGGYSVEESSKEAEETPDEEEKIVEVNNEEGEDAASSADVTPPQSSTPEQSNPTPSSSEAPEVQQSSSESVSSEPASSESTSSEPASSESTSSEPVSEPASEDQTPDADGFYNGLEAKEFVAERPYYYDFTNMSDIENSYTKGLFSFNAGNYNGAVYNGTTYGVEFKSGNKLTFPVSANSYIVVGGDNNNNCTDLAATSEKGTLTPSTLSTKTEGHGTLADCKKREGNNILIYEYKGEEDSVTLTVDPSYTKAEGQTSTKAYIAYVCVIPIAKEDIADADGFYNGLEASNFVAERPYYYDFTNMSDIENSYTKGLFSFNAGSYHGAAYHSTTYGVEFKSGNKLTFPVSANSYVVVGGDSNNNCTDLAATSEKGTLTPSTLSTKTEGHGTLADCKKREGNNILVYEYKGEEGSVTLTVDPSYTKAEGQTNTKAYIAYVCVIPKVGGIDPSIPHVKGKNVDGKPDVWDFAAGAIELNDKGMPTKYINEVKDVNNMLTEDIMNSWYGDNVPPGTVGPNLSSFSVKDEEGNVLLEFNGNGKSNHRIRSTSNKITKCDTSTKKVKVGEDENGNNIYEEYLGYVYSNSASEPNVYLGMMLDEGDIVTVVVSSNGGASLLHFESMDDKDIPAQVYEYKPVDGPNAAITTFYAPKAGRYKIYSANEKLVVARLTVEKTDFVTVSGTVTAPESLTKDYGVTFTNRESGAVKTAPVVNGTYTIDLNEKYTYDVSLSDANGYVVDNEERFFKLEGEGVKETDGKKSYTYDVKVKAVDLVTVTGNIKGLTDDVAGRPAKQFENLKLTFESDKIYIPELTVDTTTGAFTLVLEQGVEYAVKAEGVDDFTLDTTTISAAENKTADIEFTAKTVYDVTIDPVGATKEILANATFIFSRVYVEDSVKAYEEDYVYTFTGTEGIKLRDGQYEVKVKVEYPYKQLLTPDLKVNGANIECTIKFSSEERTKWDFTTDTTLTGNENGVQIQNAIGEFEGLKIDASSGKFDSKNRQKDAQFNNTTKVTVPVNGPCTVVINVYADTYTVNGTAASGKITTVEISEAGNVDIVATANTYLNSIEIIYPGDEYKSTITVGAKGCDYTTINDALDAVRNMSRADENGNVKRVTIVIQPGDYEEMLVIDTPNVTLKNANENPSITPVNKGVNIDKSSVRITSYYGHGYAYYSMGSDCKWNADILAANKANGCLSFENPGTGTTSGSYWNATVTVSASGFEADGIIFENSFNQYVSKKAADDIIVPLAGAKGENLGARNEMKVGSTAVQYKDYVERAAALAIYNNCNQISFNNCSFIGRQDTLYGGTGTTAAFYGCDIYGGTDYIFGGMTAVFAKCGLLFNTNDETDKGKKDDIGHITAPQQSSGRGYLLYNCVVTTTTPGVNTASQGHVNPGTFGRPWAAGTGEALFYKTIVGKTKDADGKEVSLIQPDGWNAGLSGESKFSQEYGTIELAGVDNSANRVKWSTVLEADADGNVTLADGSTKINDSNAVAAFFGDWNPFAGKDMTISEESNRVDPVNPPSGDNVAEEDDKLMADETDKKTEVNLGDTGKITVTAANLAAKGKKQQWKVTVTYKHTITTGNETKTVDQELTEGVHYNVLLVEGNGVSGKQKIVVKGTELETDLGTFVGTSKSVSYELFANPDKNKDISKAIKGLKTKSASYTGGYITSDIDWKTPVDAANYTVVYKNNVNVGKASVTVIGQGEYYGTKTLNFTIKAANIKEAAFDSTNLEIKLVEKKYSVTEKEENALTYKGEPIVFEDLSVTLGKELKRGVDYTITYKNNAKVGKASATIKALNNYTGSVKLDYTIVRTEVTKADIEALTNVPAEYTAKKGPQVLEIAVNGTTLKAGTDFKADYKAIKDDIRDGKTTPDYTNTIAIKGAGAYKDIGTANLNIKVVKGDFHIKSGITVDKAAVDKANTVKKLIAATKITDASGAKPTEAEIANITTEEEVVKIVLTDAAKANFNETEISCHVATKLSTVVKQRKANKLSTNKHERQEIMFDGVNKVTLTTEDIVKYYLEAKGTAKVNAEDIVIVSYKNNHKLGSATVTIQGADNSPYYGTMNVKFKIVTEKKPTLGSGTPEGPGEDESAKEPDSSDVEGSDVSGSSEIDPDPGVVHTVWVVGDSTVSSFTDNYYYPRYGYGTQLQNYLGNTYQVNNLALSGRSSKSFLSEANYTTLTGGIKEGDILIIGFGHNDSKNEQERYTNPNGDWQTEGSFAKSLYDNYVKIATDAKATPIICTPIVRRNGSSDTLSSGNCHISGDQTDGNGNTYPGGDYPAAIRKLGQDKEVAVVDLTALTKEYYESIGKDKTLYLHAWTNSKETSVDNTHLNIYGAKVIAKMLATELSKLTDLDISKSVINLDVELSQDKDLVSNPDYKEDDTGYQPPTKVSAYWEKYGIFSGTVFGTVNKGITNQPDSDGKIYYKLEKNSDGSMRVAVLENATKIASTEDGRAMYYYQIPANSTFTLSATATINAITANNQVGFGLMARDDMFIDEMKTGGITSDYVAAGTFGTDSKNCFRRKDGALFRGGPEINNVAVGESYDLSLSFSGTGYACKFGDNEIQTGGYDFMLTTIDSEYQYIGMFASRNADITFSNIKLTVDGKQIDIMTGDEITDEKPSEGSSEGTSEGSSEGTSEGSSEGTSEGSSEGTSEGSSEGTSEGSSESASTESSETVESASTESSETVESASTESSETVESASTEGSETVESTSTEESSGDENSSIEGSSENTGGEIENQSAAPRTSITQWFKNLFRGWFD